MEELKSDLFKITLDKVMDRVRQELNIVCSSNDRRNKKIQTELFEKREVKQEISFLREENLRKTAIIANITKSYIPHNLSFSLTKNRDEENSQQDIEINHENSVGNNRELDPKETYKTIREKVDEQLKEIRVKHNKNFNDLNISFKTCWKAVKGS